MSKAVYTKRTTAPFRNDIVGSFLRPAELKQARTDCANGKITQSELTAIEDKCIKNLIEKQIKSGLNVITDGEFRRSWWHLDFMWGLSGVRKKELTEGYHFNGETTRGETAELCGKISGANHPFVEHFHFVKQFEREGVVPRQTIPAPAQFLAELGRSSNQQSTQQYYTDENSLVADIAAAYRTVIKDLYAAGCRNIQFDDCTWGMFCDETYWKSRQNKDVKMSEIAELYLKVNNLAIEDKPADLIITTHVCRGNYHSTWASSGGYKPIAKILFGGENVSAYYLEFDDDRSGDFAPLAEVSGDKKVVLGLITSKSPKLEDRETIIKRIKEASEYIDLDRLCLSPQCGFASTEEGNILTEDEQWAKIAFVKSIAEEVWGI